jgi:hypothetical protein
MKNIIYIVILFLNLNAMEIDKNGNIKCTALDNIQKCLNQGGGKTITLVPGVYEVPMLQITKDNTVLIIQKGTIIKLKKQNYPKKDGAVIKVYKKHHKWKNDWKEIRNVVIYMDGVIDGQKDYFIPKGISYEGINIKYGYNCKVIGNGTIKNINGDGIDIDASKYCLFRGISTDKMLKLLNNSGNGLHFGSPRPIIGSRFNVAMFLYAEGNGFKDKRNGFDLSWPNPNGAIYINCVSKDNRKNWEIDGVGGEVIDCQSINTGKVLLNNTFGGACRAIINNKDVTDKELISKKTKILIKYHIKKFFGMKIQEFLKDVTF